jgi:hypothetical protein
MSEEPYQNREIDSKFKSLEDKLLDPETGILPRIEIQTCKTNGRVTRLERLGLIIITALFVLFADNPVTSSLISSLLKIIGL